jgi:hypothetical protein
LASGTADRRGVRQRITPGDDRRLDRASAASQANASCRLPPWAVGLVYELLDAHHDTVRMFDEPATEQAWESHLDYLRALQRSARHLLASSEAPIT